MKHNKCGECHGMMNSALQRVVIVSSSLLTDRMLLYTQLLQSLHQGSQVDVWTASLQNGAMQAEWARHKACVQAFPRIRPFKEFPYNYPLRRFNELVWDFRLRPPSRLGMLRHVRSRRWAWHMKILVPLARTVAAFGIEESLEKAVERCLLSYSRSSEARKRLERDRPDVVVTMRPHFYEEPAVVLEAKRLGIPVMAFITSWDNLSTKNRLVFRYDAFLVWSEQMRAELYHFYPYSRKVPVYVVGAPQFDVFFQDRFRMNRKEFCAWQDLRPDKPIIVYALGSPNFIPGEWYGAYFLAQRLARGELGDVQMIVRPHPLFDDGRLQARFREFTPRVVVQKTGQAGVPLSARFQDEKAILEWVNTFRHADVVVNFASTVTVDAAIMDRPVVNLDFDPEPGHPHQALVHDVNHLWTHYKPVAESGGVWLVRNMDEMVEAIRTYLRNPSLHREKRRWIAEYVCGYVDGRSGERMARAILDFLDSRDVAKGG